MPIVRCDRCAHWKEAAVGSAARPLDASTLGEKPRTGLGGLVQRPVYQQCLAVHDSKLVLLSDSTNMGEPALYTQGHFGCQLFKEKTQ